MTTEAPPQSVVETLRRARALIENPRCWTQGAYTRLTEDRFIAHCPGGALCAIGGAFLFEADQLFRSYLRDKHSVISIAWWNDQPHQTHAQVLEAFDAVIALAES